MRTRDYRCGGIMPRPARYELADWLLKGVAVLLAFGLVVGLLVWLSEVLAAWFA